MQRAASPCARARRFVSGEDDFQNDPGILPCHFRLKVQPDAINKMGHFLVKAVIPGLLIDGEAPALVSRLFPPRNRTPPRYRSGLNCRGASRRKRRPCVITSARSSIPPSLSSFPPPPRRSRFRIRGSISRCHRLLSCPHEPGCSFGRKPT